MISSSGSAISRRRVSAGAMRSYAKLPPVLEVPNLVQIQLNSYRWFRDEGLKELFGAISPIQDFTSTRLELHFRDCEFRQPKYSEHECHQRADMHRDMVLMNHEIEWL